jgi:dihydrofolate reductase
VGRLVAFVLSTLDGAVDRPDRSFPGDYDPTMTRLEAELIGSQRSVLLGRRMYDEWSRYWPTSDVQPFADFINSVPKTVLSSRPLTPSAWDGAERVSGPLETVVGGLRERPGDVGVHGSISLVRSLLAADLLDELQLVVAPVVDPDGRRLFEGVPGPRRLALVSATPTESGATWLVLRPAP